MIALRPWAARASDLDSLVIATICHANADSPPPVTQGWGGAVPTEKLLNVRSTSLDNTVSYQPP